jgi:hypothetical protein
MTAGIYVHTIATFILCNFLRCRTRANLIPFVGPAVGPRNADEQRAYAELTSNIHDGKYSGCIGWVIQQREALLAEVRSQEGAIQEIMSSLSMYSPRLQQGWSVALFFAKRVC